jgi:predicted NAD/FAD-dependent oxidoreductase
MAGHTSHPETIAIVGAGIAGLTTAKTLSARDMNVRLFDKGRTPGGRVSTRCEAAYQFDHGAQYFTVRDECFRKTVNGWVDEGTVHSWDPRVILLEHGNALAIPHTVERFVGVPGMSQVPQALASGLEIYSGTEVGEVGRVGERWEIRSKDGRELGDFDTLLMTVPRDQALALLGGLPGPTGIAPGPRLHPCWTAMAVFEEATEIDWDAAYVHQSPLFWAARNNSKPGRPDGEAWVVHGTSEWSEAHLGEEPEVVCEVLLQAFFDSAGIPARSARFSKAHRWRFALVENALDVASFWDADQRLGVGGDWCLEGSIEGAYLSGLNLAERVLGESFDC